MLNARLSSTVSSRFRILPRMNATSTGSSRLKEARDAAGLSQAKLAELVGVSRAAVNQWENGDIKSLRPENLFKVARALNCSAEWLATGNGSKEPVEIIANAVDALEPADRQAVFDFIQYKIDRAPNIVASESVSRYHAMIERIVQDMKKRTEGR